MKNIYKIGLSFLLIMGFLVSCQTTDPVILGRSVKPVVSVSTASVNVMGETKSVITITTATPATKDLIFKLVQTSGDAVSGVDYQFAEDSAPDYGAIGGRIVIPAYATSGSTEVTGISDFVDGTKSADFKLMSIESMQATVGGASQVSLTISDFFDPTKLTLIFGWDAPYDGNDYDMVTWSDTATYPHTEWGDGGATGANPEKDNSIWLSDPVGTYYVNVIEWGNGVDFVYHFTILHTDGSIQKISGIFKGSDTSIYTNDNWLAWGGSGYDSFRVLKVVNDGTKFTVTAL